MQFVARVRVSKVPNTQVTSYFSYGRWVFSRSVMSLPFPPTWCPCLRPCIPKAPLLLSSSPLHIHGIAGTHTHVRVLLLASAFGPNLLLLSSLSMWTGKEEGWLIECARFVAERERETKVKSHFLTSHTHEPCMHGERERAMTGKETMQKPRP